MALPLHPPLAPQLARSAKEVPRGDGWSYERKLDGFRAIVFVDGDAVHIQSRGGKPLDRYFPELRFGPGRYVVDGEIVVAGGRGGREDFGALQQRIHPAESRVRMLAEATPAAFAAFDLLAEGDAPLLERPFAERRARLEALAPGAGLAPVATSTDPEDAAPWLTGSEGVIAKRLDAPYRPGERQGMVKIKRVRTLDCVVMGWRPGKLEGTVGSLILGLYDGGALRPVGHCAGFTGARKRGLRDELAPYETGGRGSGEASRWSGGRDLEWVEMRPELVAEVSYDHASDGRIRHGARLLRWRHDRDPRSCTVDQLEA
ncbi:ATP-dependent DNA ligase [Miltoncostaea marina]|uniref:ATP-dependent DNA ligase n=1 Tax=Miltoncostaea marina TaxID=2843215 RepID=UPI001C3E4C47|nr:ATP-dependent DNA ligase [Miltoncostaea marina]